MNNDVKTILLVGVGGQGTLLASRVLGTLLINKDYDVKVSEVHGMSQRGGSVVTYVRYGTKVHSPVVSESEADVIVAFEELEAYRWLPFLKDNGTYIVNTQNIMPMPVIIGAAQYPEGISDELKAKCQKTVVLDALTPAVSAGSAKAVNIVLLGVLAKNMDIDKQLWLDAVKTTVPEKLLDVNIAAFNAGYNY